MGALRHENSIQLFLHADQYNRLMLKQYYTRLQKNTRSDGKSGTKQNLS
mgnify:CR=1 FL=1|jgi:hypothetical protein